MDQPQPGDSPALTPLDGFRLDGKVAMVTGASSGLGARFTRVLHSAGAKLVVTARRRDRLADLAAELPGTVVVAADLADAADRERAVAEALEQVGHIDVLVNNAGTSHIVGVEDETVDQFEQVLQINTVAVWHMSKLVGAAMVDRGSGSIINVASMYGLVGMAPMKGANYCASKGAVVNLTRELALQWARRGVRVNALCPGFFPSELTVDMVDDEASQAYLRTHSPIPRMGAEHELDGPLLLLAGDAGSYITGHALAVDGGFTAR